MIKEVDEQPEGKVVIARGPSGVIYGGKDDIFTIPGSEPGDLFEDMFQDNPPLENLFEKEGE